MFLIRSVTKLKFTMYSTYGLMSHIRETSKVTINTSYFHPAHQHYNDEAQKAETVPSVVRYCSMGFRSY